MRQRLGRVCALAATAVLTATLTGTPVAHAQPDRDVMFVGNNWDGTVDLIDARTLEKYQRIDVVPDLSERKSEMRVDQYIAMRVIRETAGEGHDQLVDDIMVAPDGRTMYVSRPSLGDVAAFDIASGEIVGRFDAGDFPHENRYSADGDTIYNASIGNVIAPDAEILDPVKGKRQLTIADADTLEVTDTIEFEAGIRPFIVLPDERTMYAQLSFHNGFIEYDLDERRRTRTVHLPLSEQAREMDRSDYPLDSAHHGLAMNNDHSKICDAGTISDYAAVLSVPELTVDSIVDVGDKPYWAATSPDGRYCFLSNSDSDDISVVSYDDPREIARIPVGDHPQRVRGYTVPSDVLNR